MDMPPLSEIRNAGRHLDQVEDQIPWVIGGANCYISEHFKKKIPECKM
jgi:hypothetical protein